MAAAIALGQVQNRARAQGSSDVATLAARALTLPAVNGLNGAAKAWDETVNSFLHASSLRKELDRLRGLEAAAALYENTVKSRDSEIAQLRKLLGMPNFGKSRVAARIVGYFPYENRMTLSVGKRQGVGVGLPVVSAEGLLGIVQTVDADTCQANLAVSPAVQFGAYVQREPEVPGLVKGETPIRLVLNALEDGDVHVGDSVLTSGYSDRIPRGIPVGTVVEVVPDPNYGTRRIFIAPSARVGSTLEVFVLK